MTVWWPTWLGVAILGLLLGAAMAVRRAGGACPARRWTAGDGVLAALAGIGCCGLALPGAVFAGLAALSPLVELADELLVAACGWTLYRTLVAPACRAHSATAAAQRCPGLDGVRSITVGGRTGCP